MVTTSQRFRQKASLNRPRESIVGRQTVDGPFEIEEFNFPTETRRGGVVSVDVRVRMTQDLVVYGTGNCNPSPLALTDGIQGQLILFREGVEMERNTYCFPAPGSNLNPQSFTFQTTAGTGSSTDFEFQVRNKNGDVVISRQFTVAHPTEEADNGTCPPGTALDPDTGDCVRIECGGNADCPEGFVCENGVCVEAEPEGGGPQVPLPCFIDPDRECSTGETLGFAAAGLIATLLLAG